MRRFVGSLAAAALLAGAVGCGTADSPQGSPSSTTSPAGTASTDPSDGASSSAGGTPSEEVPVDATSAIFPTADSDVRFTSPEAAATAFAADYVGMPTPLVAAFQAADARSGEVDIRSRPAALPSTVVVRQLEDGNWWVLGSGMQNIQLDQPAGGARITSPQPLAGKALAYEGHVDVELRADGVAEPIATTFVTGGGDVLRPFDGSLTFEKPAQPYGAILLITRSGQDGSVVEFVAVRVAF